ncbi:hypothetical protein [Neisseria iguanae]|uniref:Uncharacterized protein n=1 Tax=Neisseria iguanae TaxID=90242 RepID=A0A2P7U273_9NEIS|nr:hypothetical protein [Neisseria iguanae]PSJ81057.1 hypothetical protein C7N83_02710 [Neisseria iguanae]
MLAVLYQILNQNYLYEYNDSYVQFSQDKIGVADALMVNGLVDIDLKPILSELMWDTEKYLENIWGLSKGLIFGVYLKA